MAQLRLRVNSIRAMLRGLVPLFEADDPNADDPEAGERKKQKKELDKLSIAYNDVLRALPKSYSGGDKLTPDQEMRYAAAWKRYNDIKSSLEAAGIEIPKKIAGNISASPATIKLGVPQKPAHEPGAAEFNAKLGSGRTLKASSGPLVNKDYTGKSLQAPYLTPPTQARTVSKEELAAFSPKAAALLPDWDGALQIKNGYLILIPTSSVQRTMVWAGVPAKGDRPELPKAWRTIDELNKEQRDKLGWIDSRDKGSYPKKEPTKFGDENWGRKEPDVRFKSGRGEIADIEVMGHVPGATSEHPGHGGGIPTSAAKAAADRAFAAKHAKLPDWETLNIQELQTWKDVVSRKLKTSHDPADQRILAQIEDAIGDRMRGTPPKPKPRREFKPNKAHKPQIMTYRRPKE